MAKIFYWLMLITFLVLSHGVYANDNINMKDIRQLAELPVDEILKESPIEIIEINSYWVNVHSRKKPLVVLFYSNNDGASQRIATLIKYISSEYNNKLAFGRVRVSKKGKPNKGTAKILSMSYSLDDTPGILFYDNVGTEMVLEDEDYIDADFKEFRTPSMFLWKTYYKAVREKLNKLLAD